MQDTKLKPPGVGSYIAIYLVIARHWDETSIATMAGLLATPAGASV
jgi:hypothetical protein